MLNALYPKIDWDEIEVIGFDMDGTLYDEFEFITQVYAKIIDDFKESISNPVKALSYMHKRWLEKGSSYNKIFDETYDKYFDLKLVNKTIFLNSALKKHREFDPNLELAKRNRVLLTNFKKKHDLFIVTDGNYELQKRKFLALGLDSFFEDQNVFFTGKLGSKYYKPSVKCLENVNFKNKRVIFIGDREVDDIFARAAGFEFLKVYNMVPVK